MSKPRTGTTDKKPRGTVQCFKDARGRKYWRARVTFADGERLYVGPRFYSEERAREKADEEGRKAAGKTIDQIAPAPTKPKTAVETCNEWHARYLAYCVERGIATTGDKKYRWQKWIAPRSAPRPWAR